MRSPRGPVQIVPEGEAGDVQRFGHVLEGQAVTGQPWFIFGAIRYPKLAHFMGHIW